VPSNLWSSRWLRVCVGNINEVLDRNLSERDNLGLLDQLVSEIQNNENWDVNVRGNKGLCIPSVIYVSEFFFNAEM
jgi:hypothetical protein